MFSRSIHVLKPSKASLAVLLVLMFFCLAQLNAAPIMPGAPDYSWAFDDGSGATTATATNGAVNGQIVGASDSSNTKFSYTGNRALDFDGSNDRVDLDGIDLSSGGNSAVTISAWVYSQDTDNSKKAQIFGNWFQGDDKQTVSLFDYTGGARMIAQVVGDVTSSTSSSGGDFARGEWVHLVGILDGSVDKDGWIAVYVNGTLDDNNHNAGALRNISDEGTYGIGGDAGTTDSLRYFDGLIDEVAVWRSVLTNDNIEWLQTNSMTTIPEPSSLLAILLGSLTLLGFRRR
ncbi:MAG: PEP-CTERM sorting domain-containing protein [Pirellulales bacterium]|nr:PEP-CTERM sorting domain-containing protein [Pirellulales bacterium]